MTNDVRELTRELVSISSHEDETAAGDAIEAWLREETDAEVTRDEAGNTAERSSARSGMGSGNVFARKGSGPTLALVGHHDVVPPADEQVKGGEYVVEERDGRLYGRGAADMKGAVAAAMYAFRDADPAGELVFASFVGEESGGVGARHAIENGFSPEYAIVCEGSTNYSGSDVTDVAVAHKGRRGSTITARGSASHASEPEAGENAIYRACEAVETIRGFDAPETTVLGNRLSGSIAVTEIEGGSAMNVIPDRCTVTVDERTVPGERAPMECVDGIDGVEWAVDQDLPPMRCSDENFAEAVLAAARREQDGEPALVGKPHATDAGWLAAAGTACVVCGPAEPGEAHTSEESVSLDVLSRCYRLYREAATNNL
ncbi:MAG: M20/M25/M40 family metallo-hydrolase [Euryarchaeota archaeon]|nr:M20/M25/M40 family metallo-hydrolase [Euryarchaeota archaeon]